MWIAMYFIHPENCELVELDPDTLIETPIPYESEYIGVFSVVENRLFITNCEYAKLQYADTSIPPGDPVEVIEYTNISEIEQLCYRNNAYIIEKTGKMVSHELVPISTGVDEVSFSTLGEGFLLSKDMYNMYVKKLNGTIDGQTMHPLPVCKFHDSSIVPPD